MSTVLQLPTTFALARGVVGVFTSKDTGNLAHRRPHVPGELHRSRAVLAESLGVQVGDLHFMRQVHSGTVGVVEQGTVRGGEFRDVDALVTAEPGRALVVQAADCVPVLLAADGGPVGVAHAGREGVAAGVVPNAVSALGDLGADPADLHVAIGPAIGGCCYEVPDPLAVEFDRRLGGVEGAVAMTSWGTTSLDLPAVVAWQLAQAGVRDVQASPGCTRCDPDGRWFSHRLDPSAGRQVGAVVAGAGFGAGA